ncbi:MAG: hypothetical protein JSW51_12715 [Gemmatimonadota bacterium]|nr:MAG: hypothetical protein JSW51_12715 [Gemmatimonadota bacterium]
MSPLILQLIAAVLFAIVAWLGAHAALGPERRKDPILLAGVIVATGFLVGGTAGAALGENDSVGFLALGLLLAIWSRARWSRSRSPSRQV